jgi:phosphatidylglycerol:prolipoprotein diacylglycerol transferase
MLQELFQIPLPHFLQNLLGRPYLPIYGYGLMLVIGFLLAAQLARFLARRCGFDGEAFVNAGLLALITGVIGARLSHILESLADPTNQEFARNGHTAWENFKAMLNVSSGGLTFYGGFLVATPVLIFYAIRKRIPLLKGMDIIAPCLMIGLAFGRIGCYLNGCCFGEECGLPWGARFPYGSNAFVEQYEKGEIVIPSELTDPEHLIPRVPAEPGHVVVNPSPLLPRLWTKDEVRRKSLEKLADSVQAKPVNPTELYSAFNAFLIAAILLAFFSLNPNAGRVFALMLILKGASRYTLEMIRVEPPVLGNLSFSMVLSIILILAGILMWFACGKRVDRSSLKAAPA